MLRRGQEDGSGLPYSSKKAEERNFQNGKKQAAEKGRRGRRNEISKGTRKEKITGGKTDKSVLDMHKRKTNMKREHVVALAKQRKRTGHCSKKQSLELRPLSVIKKNWCHKKVPNENRKKER